MLSDFSVSTQNFLPCRNLCHRLLPFPFAISDGKRLCHRLCHCRWRSATFLPRSFSILCSSSAVSANTSATNICTSGNAFGYVISSATANRFFLASRTPIAMKFWLQLRFDILDHSKQLFSPFKLQIILFSVTAPIISKGN